MLKAQEEAYGEALATRHPYMWAVKGHYYGADFYNYPYTFGLLFGLAVYQEARRTPASPGATGPPRRVRPLPGQGARPPLRL